MKLTNEAKKSAQRKRTAKNKIKRITKALITSPTHKDMLSALAKYQGEVLK